MKYLSSQLSFFLNSSKTKKNLKVISIYVLFLFLIISLYSFLFHVIMEMEGKHYSWITGIYWTLTVMSTLGFGDITFSSDLGMIFSILVLSTGIIFLLVILPFTFIQFFYAPWLEAQMKTKTPRSLDPEVKDHVIITHYDGISRSLINKLNQNNYPYVIVTEDHQEALKLIELKMNTVYGDIDSTSTYKKLNLESAKMVVNSGSDMINTNITYTVRELTSTVPIISISESPDSVDILELAGSNYVFQLYEILGKALARRTVGGFLSTNVVGEFEQLKIAETIVRCSPFAGKTLKEIGLRKDFNVNVIGLWEEGEIMLPHPDYKLKPEAVLIIAGVDADLSRFDLYLRKYHPSNVNVLVIGGGKVGRAAAKSLSIRNLPFKIIEKKPELILNDTDYIQGSAADYNTLINAGINNSQSVIITTNDDDVNIYLTIYCKKLNPDIQIICRVNHDKNITTMRRAGADFILSYASLGRNAIFNYIEGKSKFILEEGLILFKAKVSDTISGKSLSELDIRNRTGCSVIAIQRNGENILNPDPFKPIEPTSTLIVAGTLDSEKKFYSEFL